MPFSRGNNNIHVLSGGFVSHFFIPSKVTNCEKESFPHLATLNKVYESDLPRNTRCPIAWRRLKTV